MTSRDLATVGLIIGGGWIVYRLGRGVGIARALSGVGQAVEGALRDAAVERDGGRVIREIPAEVVK